MGVKFAYHANCWGPLGGNAVGVTSISELTYVTFGDMERAIDDIGHAGYSGIEMFDGNLLAYAGRAADLKRSLDAAGLKLVATYSGGNFIFDEVLAEELARIERAASIAAELGAEHLVVGGGAKRSAGIARGDMDKLANALDKVVAVAKKMGLRAHYHPHLSTIVEGPQSVHEVFRQTAIDFCPDTAHLAAAGGDPAALVKELSSRISYVHLKGLQRQPFAFTPLDAGDLDNSSVIEALKAASFSGWVTAELDSWSDPYEGSVRSLEFMQVRFGQK
jgi:inosose dehydratase